MLDAALVGKHAGDHVVRHRGEVDLSGGQLGVTEDPLGKSPGVVGFRSLRRTGRDGLGGVSLRASGWAIA